MPGFRLPKLGIIVLLALAMSILGPPAGGAEPAASTATVGDTADESAAIHSLVQQYFAAFTAKDYQDFSQFFAAPFLRIGKSIDLIATVPEVVRAWIAIRDPLDHTDYAASRPVQIRVTMLSGGRGMANIHWQRLRRDGTVLDEGAEFYLVTKQSGRWQIDGVMGQDLKDFAR
jgi:hypothetical protein